MTGMNIRPLAECKVDPAMIEKLIPIVSNLLDEMRLHSETDVALAVEEMQSRNDQWRDAFILVANHISRRYGPDNLLAVESIRKWAESNAPHLLD